MNNNIQSIDVNEEAENWHQKMTKWFENSVEVRRKSEKYKLVLKKIN